MFADNLPDIKSSSFSNTVAAIARHPFSAFVPQMLATMAAGFIIAWRHDLAFACFIQTVTFVTFNKVCTSQVRTDRSGSSYSTTF